ncbi:MAG: CDP-alcohol phosphatidyltransferase family protein [Acidimicrobiia bacterium]
MGRRVLTVPNALSVMRLLCVPVFVWLLFATDERTVTYLFLGFLGGTDWVDGWIARRFHQESELGKILDPVADRVLLLTATICLMIEGVLPTWVGVAILVREGLVSAATLGLALAGARRIDVTFIGKCGAFALMMALPGFLLVDTLQPGSLHDAFSIATWVLTIGGLVLSYLAAAGYVRPGLEALRAGRADRRAADAAPTGATP